MANENTILTALGLDLTQFESGTSQAAGTVKGLAQALNAVDGELRKIPIVGELYTATFGRITEGFAESVEQGREFARIMATDVSGSLSGTQTQIEDVTETLRQLKVGSFGRSIADSIKDIGTSGGLTGQTQASKRQEQIVALEKKRMEMLKTIYGLSQLDAAAKSDAVSQSSKLSEQARNTVAYESRKVEIQEESFKLYGPNQEKERSKYVKEQGDLAASNFLKEDKAIAKRYAFQQLSLASSVRQAEMEASGANTTEAVAQENLRLAIQERELAVTKEGKTAASAKIIIANEGLKIASRATQLEQAQLDLVSNEASIRKSGYNETVRLAEQRLAYAREEQRIAVGDRAQQKSAASVENAKTELKVATESRAQYEDELTIAMAIASNRNDAAEAEGKSLADQQRAAEASLSRMKQAGGMEDAIKAKELEIAQISKSRWQNSLNRAKEALSITQSQIQAQTTIDRDSQRRAAQAQQAAAKANAASVRAAGGTPGEIAEADAAAQQAENASKEFELQQKLSIHTAELQTEAMRAQVSGQTRAANQAQIRLQYESQIADALAHGNTELAGQLQKQQGLAQLQEAIRQYELGGKGRANERREERRRARITRTVESRERSKEENVQRDTVAGGLTSGGLRSGGGMSAPQKHPSKNKVHIDGAQQFTGEVLRLLSNLEK